MRCLDTDILIAILRGNKDADRIVDILDKEGKASTTVINAYEILFGAKKSLNREENLKEARKLLAKLDVINMSIDCSEIASEIHANLSKEGNLIDIRDIFIASIALSHGCNIITRNVKDFSKIKGMKIEKW